MNARRVREALYVPDQWPVLVWDATQERWMTVAQVKSDDDRVVLLLEPFE